ncbi:hypothetical protein ACIBH1_01875 [Nonomuraea sp. NPDC050663]|uniref:hypothetical protein n=1 Tax=Nonomuraea sp. NPDC050663 TaxID=3364370 RepID=UPI00379B2AF7
MIRLVVSVLIATTLITAPAEAAPAKVPPAETTRAESAPPDPVSVLTAKLTTHHGVKVVERHRLTIDGEPFADGTRRGVISFRPSGYDTTNRTSLGKVRVLAVGRHTYMSGGPITSALPKGKTWFKTSSKPSRRTPFYGPILLTEPATLRALLATATTTTGRVRSGVIGSKALARVSPSFATKKAFPIGWKLWLGRTGLPTRLVTTWTEQDALGELGKSSDIRFSSWGRKVTLVAPPASKTAT